MLLCTLRFSSTLVLRYDTDGFLEKNKDALPAEAAAVVSASTQPLVRALFQRDDAAASSADAPPSLGSPSSPLAIEMRSKRLQLRLEESSMAGAGSSAAPPSPTLVTTRSSSSGRAMATMTVGTQFKAQLGSLLRKAHYSRLLPWRAHVSLTSTSMIKNHHLDLVMVLKSTPYGLCNL